MKMKTMILSLLNLLLFSANISAKVTKEDLEKFYDSLVENINVTKPDIYEGQRAGIATGGGFVIRSRLTKSQLTGIQLPNIKAGCGGIDLYGGGISFINREELVEALKAVGQNSLGYAFSLGLEAVSPMIKNNIMETYNWALENSYYELNSCELAHNLVDGLGKRLNMANKQCTAMLTESGEADTMTTARSSCDTGNPNNAGNMPTENIAWKSLMQHDIFRNDKELAENIMTLTGTVISRMVEGRDKEMVPDFVSFPSKAEDGFLEYLLNGGKYQIYSCGNEYKQCLNIKSVEKTTKKNESWVAKINNIIDSVHEKYLKDEGELSAEEEDLITRTDFPVWRIISVLTAYQGNDKPISVWGLSDIIATDLLLMYVKDCVSFLKEGAKKYRMEKMYCDQVDQFIDELKYVEATIQYYELKNSDRFYRKFELIERIDRIEEKMMSEIRF